MARRALHRAQEPGPEAWHLPPEWESYGARWGTDGLLYLAEWRRGFTVFELRSLFFECQQVRTLSSEKKQLVEDLDELHKKVARLEAERAFYRRQCHYAAGVGIALLPYPGP